MVIGLLLQIRQEVDKAWATTMDNFVNSQQGGTHVADFHGKLSKPQPKLNTTVGFDMKMTLQTPPHPPPSQKLFRHF